MYSHSPDQRTLNLDFSRLSRAHHIFPAGGRAQPILSDATPPHTHVDFVAILILIKLTGIERAKWCITARPASTLVFTSLFPMLRIPLSL